MKIILLLLVPFSLLRAQRIARVESVQSLYLECYKDDLLLGSATGFVIRSRSGRPYLITNYHVVTNKASWNDSWISPQSPVTPNKIRILHNGRMLGTHIPKSEILITKGNDTLWRKTRIGNEMVDVIELPLTDTFQIGIFPVNYSNTIDSIIISPTERVFVPGFPKGVKSENDFSIWKSGFIASEPDINQEGKPIIWLDEVGWPGMSGSPVYYISNQILYTNGSSSLGMGAASSFFVGVFSHGRSDGLYSALWKGTYLKIIFDNLP